MTASCGIIELPAWRTPAGREPGRVRMRKRGYLLRGISSHLKTYCLVLVGSLKKESKLMTLSFGKRLRYLFTKSLPPDTYISTDPSANQPITVVPLVEEIPLRFGLGYPVQQRQILLMEMGKIVCVYQEGDLAQPGYGRQLLLFNPSPFNLIFEDDSLPIANNPKNILFVKYRVSLNLKIKEPQYLLRNWAGAAKDLTHEKLKQNLQSGVKEAIRQLCNEPTAHTLRYRGQLAAGYLRVSPIFADWGLQVVDSSLEIEPEQDWKALCEAILKVLLTQSESSEDTIREEVLLGEPASLVEQAIALLAPQKAIQAKIKQWQVAGLVGDLFFEYIRTLPTT